MKHTYTKTKTKQAHKINVGLDLFGNAIPEVKSGLVDGTGKALRVVKRHEMVIKPSPKRARAASRAKTSTSKALVAVPPTVLGRLIAWRAQPQPACQTG